MDTETSLPSKPTLDFAYESFLLDVRARNLRPATLRYYRDQLRPFIRFANEQGAYTSKALSPNIIRAFLTAVQARGVTDGTVHAAARAVRAFCNFLAAEGLVEQSPMRRVKMPKRDRPRPDAFTPAEVAQLLDACPTARDVAIVLCLLDTGARAGEFLALDVGDVNLKTGAVLLRKTKSREERTCYLGFRARRAILHYLAGRANVAPGSPAWVTLTGGTRLTYHGLKQLLRRVGKAAGIPGVNAHKFRRTFALWSLRSGMPLLALQKLLGHADTQMLKHYVGLTEADLQEAHGQYGPADNQLGKR